MSKASLREFQAHLAQRLQAAQSGASPSRWLAVLAGSHRLLLPLQHAGEISPVSTWVPLPHARPWFRGLVNLRGQICGVVHLGQFLGDAASAIGPQARLIQFAAALDINTALLVDQLVGLRNPEQLQPAEAEPSPGPAWLRQSLRDATQQLWREVDLLALADDPQFLTVT